MSTKEDAGEVTTRRRQKTAATQDHRFTLDDATARARRVAGDAFAALMLTDLLMAASR